jgi:Peptidase S46
MVSSSVKCLLVVILVFAASFFAPTTPAPAPAPMAPMAAPVAPEEGMWTFDNLPLAQLKAVYGFEPTKEWIDHVRMSSVKYDSGGGGGSSSFVSPNGLMMTNHHVALGTVNKLSTAEHDYVRDGFSAKAFGKEPKAPGFTLKQLMEIRDITAAAVAASKDLKDAGEIAKARAEYGIQAAKEASDAEKHILAEPIALYDGSELHLYVYRTYSDVRLVFAPEQQIAFFGGDPDNFTYPRYDLDCAFFRVYENDKPLDTSKNFFKWSAKGAGDGELIFVPGNPGDTNRVYTYAQLEFDRDLWMPLLIASLTAQREVLGAIMAKGTEEQIREVRDQFFGIENSLKKFKGHLSGLRDAEMMALQKTREEELIKKANDPAVTEAINAIAVAQKKKAEVLPRAVFSNMRELGRYQKLLAAAAKGGSEATAKADLPKLKDSERGRLEARLSMAKQFLPPTDPLSEALGLKDLDPKGAVDRLMSSKLFDAEFRAELMKGGREAVEKSDDPLVATIRTLQSVAEQAQARMETEVNPVEGENLTKLGEARYKVYGKSRYPDATFTLRLSYGTVKGYEAGTTKVPYKTTFNGLYERNTAFDNKAPFHLPKRWFDKQKDLNLSTPLNFVCTADIIGGNSGSPIINRDAEVVGLIFDGNIESLPGNYWYDARFNRSVGVHSAGIVEALDKVYGEAELVKELTGK